jgi:hypothetical protein
MANEESWQKRILAVYVRFVSEGRDLRSVTQVEDPALAYRDASATNDDSTLDEILREDRLPPDDPSLDRLLGGPDRRAERAPPLAHRLGPSLLGKVVHPSVPIQE